MRTSMLSAAFAAALAVTAWSPDRAHAQVVIYPTVNTSPYAFTNYWAPTYSYAYTRTTPFYSGVSYGWSNPFNYGNYMWYNTRPYYAGYGYNNWGWPGNGYGRGSNWPLRTTAASTSWFSGPDAGCIDTTYRW